MASVAMMAVAVVAVVLVIFTDCVNGVDDPRDEAKKGEEQAEPELVLHACIWLPYVKIKHSKLLPSHHKRIIVCMVAAK